MGSGGTTALLPPGKFCFIRPLLRSDLICIRLKIFSHPPKQPSLHACRSTLEDPRVPSSNSLAQKNGYGETVESCDKKRQVGSANLMDKNAMA